MVPTLAIMSVDLSSMVIIELLPRGLLPKMLRGMQGCSMPQHVQSELREAEGGKPPSDPRLQIRKHEAAQSSLPLPSPSCFWDDNQ